MEELKRLNISELVKKGNENFVDTKKDLKVYKDNLIQILIDHLYTLSEDNLEKEVKDIGIINDINNIYGRYEIINNINSVITETEDLNSGKRFLPQTVKMLFTKKIGAQPLLDIIDDYILPGEEEQKGLYENFNRIFYGEGKRYKNYFPLEDKNERHKILWDISEKMPRKIYPFQRTKEDPKIYLSCSHFSPKGIFYISDYTQEELNTIILYDTISIDFPIDVDNKYVDYYRRQNVRDYSYFRIYHTFGKEYDYTTFREFINQMWEFLNSRISKEDISRLGHYLFFKYAKSEDGLNHKQSNTLTYKVLFNPPKKNSKCFIVDIEKESRKSAKVELCRSSDRYSDLDMKKEEDYELDSTHEDEENNLDRYERKYDDDEKYDDEREYPNFS